MLTHTHGKCINAACWAKHLPLFTKGSKSFLKFSFSEKATKIWKNLPLVLTLLSKNNCFVKTGGRFFQILWPSHNIWTLNQFFRIGAIPVLTKLSLRFFAILCFLKVNYVHPPKPKKEGVNQVLRKWTSPIAIFISLQSGLSVNLLIKRVDCPIVEDLENQAYQFLPKIQIYCTKLWIEHGKCSAHPFAIQWTIYSATTFLEKFRKVVREIWFEKSGSRNLVREKWLTKKKGGFIP